MPGWLPWSWQWNESLKDEVYPAGVNPKLMVMYPSCPRSFLLMGFVWTRTTDLPLPHPQLISTCAVSCALLQQLVTGQQVKPPCLSLVTTAMTQRLPASVCLPCPAVWTPQTKSMHVWLPADTAHAPTHALMLAPCPHPSNVPPPPPCYAVGGHHSAA